MFITLVRKIAYIVAFACSMQISAFRASFEGMHCVQWVVNTFIVVYCTVYVLYVGCMFTSDLL